MALHACRLYLLCDHRLLCRRWCSFIIYCPHVRSAVSRCMCFSLLLPSNNLSWLAEDDMQ